VIVGTVIDVIAALAIGAGLIVFQVFRSRNDQSSEPGQEDDSHEFAECNVSIEPEDWSAAGSETNNLFSGNSAESFKAFESS
jgi:hypothetical protein